MSVPAKALRISLAVVVLCAAALAADFEWNWRNQEVIGRNDTSVGNTSKLKDADRAALIDLIAARLQKPMSERGYDAGRIREIASTTRVRFVDLGDGKPVIFATSVGMEGGCDPLSNCPLWIFRKDPDAGYVSLLDTIGASYTIQDDGGKGLSDLVIMRHVSAKESGLALMHYDNGKYEDAGCYVAIWPATKAKDDDDTANQIEDPEVHPCQAGEPKPEAKSDEPKPESKGDEAKPDNAAPEPKPDVKADEAKPAAAPDAATATDQPKPDAKADEVKPAQQPDSTAPADQPKPDVKPDEAKPVAPPDSAAPTDPPKPDAAADQPQPPASPDPGTTTEQPKPDATSDQPTPAAPPDPGATPDQPKPDSDSKAQDPKPNAL